MAPHRDPLTLALDLIARIRKPGGRVLVAIAGAPGSGKSTLASDIVRALQAREGDTGAALVPMDGFHLENEELSRRGLLAVKGAPETFDVDGFVALLRAIRSRDGPLRYPVFDRAADRTVPDTGRLDASVPVVVVEGNYLLLQEGAWAALKPLFDATIMLSVPLEVLQERLVERWLNHGLSPGEAVARAEGNDRVNAITVARKSAPADLTLEIAAPHQSATPTRHMRAR